MSNHSSSIRINAIDGSSKSLQKIAKTSQSLSEKLSGLRGRVKELEAQGSKIESFKKLKQEISGTSSKIQTAQADLKSLSGEMKNSDKKLELLSTKFQQADLKVLKLAEQMGKAEKPSAELRRSYQNAKKEAAGLNRALKNAQRENKTLSRQFDEGARSAKKLADSHKNSILKLNELRSSIRQSIGPSKGFSQAQRDIRKETEQLNVALEKQRHELNRVQDLQAKQAARKSTLNSRMQFSSNATVGAYSVIQTSEQMKSALMGPVLVAAQFEEKMSGVGAVARASDAELLQLTATARRLGATTSFSASEAAEGMKYLAMANFDTQKIIAAMPGLLNLAKSGNTELAEASDISSDILSAFKLKASELGRVGDILTATFTTANTDLQMLGETMKYIGPIARTAGMSLEETSAMAGLLANVGIKASQSGTTLRAMISRLAAPTGKAGKLLDQLKVSVKDSSGNLRNMVGILGDVAKATENFGSSDRLSVIKTIFGEEPSAGLAELLDQEGTKGITKYLRVVEDSQGLAKEIADKMSDNTLGRVKELKSAFESLQITLGNVLLPVATKLTIWLTSVTRKVEELSKKHPQLIHYLAMAAAAITALAVVGGPLILAFAAVNTVMATAAFAAGSLGFASRMLGIRLTGTAGIGAKTSKTMRGLAATYTLLNTRLLTSIRSVIPAFIAALAATKARIVALTVATMTFAKGGVLGFVSGIKNMSRATLRFTVASMVGRLSMLATSARALAVGALPALAGAIKAVGLAIMANPLGVIIAAIVGIAAAVYKYWQPISAFAAGMWDGFLKGIEPLREALAPLTYSLSPVFDLITWIAGGIGSLVSGFMSLLEPVQSTQEELDDLRSTGEQVGEFIGDAFSKLAGMIKAITSGFSLFADKWRTFFGSDTEKTAKINEVREQIQKPENTSMETVKTLAKATVASAAVALPVAAEPPAVEVIEPFKKVVEVADSNAGSKGANPQQNSSDIIIENINFKIDGTFSNKEDLMNMIRSAVEQTIREVKAKSRGRLYD